MKHILLTLASAFLPVGTGGQAAGPGEIVTVDATGGITLGQLLGIAQHELGIGYFVGIGQEHQSLELQLSGTVQVRRDEFLGLFEKILRHHGLVHLEEQVGFATVHHIQPIQAGRVNLRALARVVPPGDVPAMRDRETLVTTSYTTRYLPARDAVNTLQPYFSDNATDTLRNIDGTSTIVMTGYASTLAGVLELLGRMDRAPEGLDSVALSLADRVRELEKRVQALSESSGRRGR